jgi:hypothetical protein
MKLQPLLNRALGARAFCAGIVLTGIVLPQALLYGPSLTGKKILLPLDLLAQQYMPRTPEVRSLRHHDFVLSDQIYVYEPARRFAAQEFTAGRLPLWDPYCYCGAPFAGFQKYAPLMLLYYWFPSPWTLAWIQLLKSVLAGTGAYLFFRRALGVSFWPAAIGAWCYPLTGFFALWQGYPLSWTVPWFPWLLLATDWTIRRPFGMGGPALALVTSLLIISGAIDIAGQALLAAGIYAAWCLIDEYGKKLATRRGAAGATAAALAWGLGILLAAPYLLPLVEYTKSGARMAKRESGAEERPPIGLQALPQTVLPKIYGSTQSNSFWIGASGNLLESPAAAYTGLLATLFLAPLAWCSSRHRSVNLLWLFLGFLALSWDLNVPGFVAILRLPVLNMFSHNRFVFATSFAILSLAVVGFEVLRHGVPAWRVWFWIPAGILCILLIWCLLRVTSLPEPIATELARRDVPPDWLGRIQTSYVRNYFAGAMCCLLAVAGWGVVRSSSKVGAWLGPLLGGLLIGELLWFGYDINPQCDPHLYYPPIPVLERLSKEPPGRVLGIGCLPPLLNETYHFRDIRGYDAVDPLRLMEILGIVQDPRFGSPSYAATLNYVPRLGFSAAGQIEVPKLISMLNVRYLVFRGAPKKVKPLLQDFDYWVVENKDALPRTFVPQRVEAVPDKAETLKRLAAEGFDPRITAFVPDAIDLPTDCRGSAEIVDEIPTRVTVAANMQTAGLLVLADLWYEGWQAQVDGRDVPIMRANHALRGVLLPAGRSILVFTYEPHSLSVGVRLMLTAVVALASWLTLSALRAFRGRALSVQGIPHG